LAPGLASRRRRSPSSPAIAFGSFAEYYPAEREAAPLILLFHQACSNRGEYATIAPMLVRLGFAALAVDQRSGGTALGPPQ